MSLAILNIVIFLAAFLLFQIELIIAKIFLPQYGGSFLVWGACVVFFQAALLLGYIFAHLIVTKLGVFRTRYVHFVLLLLPLLFFPGRPLAEITPQPATPVVLDIFCQLLVTIGPAFFVLSTVSIILQSWLAASHLPEKSNPYTLYAVSNLGSFAAILSYPSFFEVAFDLDTQLQFWRIGYFALIAFEALALWRISVTKESPAQEVSGQLRVSPRQAIRWFLLGSAGVIMFLSVTNLMTSEVAPIPLLWILPLCIYLISWVFNFQKVPWCPAWIRGKLMTILALSVILFFMTQRRILPFVIDLILYNVSLFAICMFCQNELARYKPADERKLTLFYVIISTGSFFGGILVSWVIPLISTSLVEYLLGLFVLSLALVIGQEKIKMGMYYIRLIVYTLALLIIWPIMFQGYHVWGLLLLGFLMISVFEQFKAKPRALCLALLAILLMTPVIDLLWVRHFYMYRHRNYYGIYKIYETNNIRFLMHATTIHGAQNLDPRTKREPLTYFSHETPVGEVLISNLFDFKHIGIVGLGTGTLAAYSKPSRSMDFFELDPDVLKIDNEHFTYIKDAPGPIRHFTGDARLSLDKIPDHDYDMIIIDAFSGDSIPVHLLTTEAIEKYRRKLKEDGVILFHVSNRYLILPPVLASNARVAGAMAGFKSNNVSGRSFASEWVALTWDKKKFDKLKLIGWSDEFEKMFGPPLRPWTDKYSNILSVMKVRDILDGIKLFKPFYW